MFQYRLERSNTLPNAPRLSQTLKNSLKGKYGSFWKTMWEAFSGEFWSEDGSTIQGIPYIQTSSYQQFSVKSLDPQEETNLDSLFLNETERR